VRSKSFFQKLYSTCKSLFSGEIETNDISKFKNIYFFFAGLEILISLFVMLPETEKEH
jgi:hypothetical protein